MSAEAAEPQAGDMPEWARIWAQAETDRKTAKPPVIMVRVDVAADLVGMSKRVFQQAIADGRAPDAAFRAQRTALWNVDELKAWAAEHCPARIAWDARWKALRHKSNG